MVNNKVTEPLYVQLNRKWEIERERQCQKHFGMSCEELEMKEAKDHVARYTPEQREQAYYNLTHPEDNTYKDCTKSTDFITSSQIEVGRRSERMTVWKELAIEDGEEEEYTHIKGRRKHT